MRSRRHRRHRCRTRSTGRGQARGGRDSLHPFDHRRSGHSQISGSADDQQGAEEEHQGHGHTLLLRPERRDCGDDSGGNGYPVLPSVPFFHQNHSPLLGHSAGRGLLTRRAAEPPALPSPRLVPDTPRGQSPAQAPPPCTARHLSCHGRRVEGFIHPAPGAAAPTRIFAGSSSKSLSSIRGERPGPIRKATGRRSP